nr:polyprotein [Rhizoctonia solani hypovirus 11]
MHVIIFILLTIQFHLAAFITSNIQRVGNTDNARTTRTKGGKHTPIVATASRWHYGFSGIMTLAQGLVASLIGVGKEEKEKKSKNGSAPPRRYIYRATKVAGARRNLGRYVVSPCVSQLVLKLTGVPLAVPAGPIDGLTAKLLSTLGHVEVYHATSTSPAWWAGFTSPHVATSWFPGSSKVTVQQVIRTSCNIVYMANDHDDDYCDYKDLPPLPPYAIHNSTGHYRLRGTRVFSAGMMYRSNELTHGRTRYTIGFHDTPFQTYVDATNTGSCAAAVSLLTERIRSAFAVMTPGRIYAVQPISAGYEAGLFKPDVAGLFDALFILTDGEAVLPPTVGTTPVVPIIVPGYKGRRVLPNSRVLIPALIPHGSAVISWDAREGIATVDDVRALIGDGSVLGPSVVRNEIHTGTTLAGRWYIEGGAFAHVLPYAQSLLSVMADHYGMDEAFQAMIGTTTVFRSYGWMRATLWKAKLSRSTCECPAQIAVAQPCGGYDIYNYARNFTCSDYADIAMDERRTPSHAQNAYPPFIRAPPAVIEDMTPQVDTISADIQEWTSYENGNTIFQSGRYLRAFSRAYGPEVNGGVNNWMYRPLERLYNTRTRASPYTQRVSSWVVDRLESMYFATQLDHDKLRAVMIAYDQIIAQLPKGSIVTTGFLTHPMRLGPGGLKETEGSTIIVFHTNEDALLTAPGRDVRYVLTPTYGPTARSGLAIRALPLYTNRPRKDVFVITSNLRGDRSATAMQTRDEAVRLGISLASHVTGIVAGGQFGNLGGFQAAGSKYHEQFTTYLLNWSWVYGSAEAWLGLHHHNIVAHAIGKPGACRDKVVIPGGVSIFVKGQHQQRTWRSNYRLTPVTGWGEITSHNLSPHLTIIKRALEQWEVCQTGSAAVTVLERADIWDGSHFRPDVRDLVQNIRRRGRVFFTFGTHGDRIPIEAVARQQAQFMRGKLIAVIHLMTREEGISMLAKCEQGRALEDMGKLTRAITDITALQAQLSIVPDYLDATPGATDVQTYTLAPPRHVAARPGGGLGKVLDKLAQLLYTGRDTSWRVGAYGLPFELPRSANGETFLTDRRHENRRTGRKGVLQGSSSVPIPPAYTGPDWETIPGGDHPQIFLSYDIVAGPGGAGFVQTAASSGCTVIAYDDSIDRKYYKPHDAGEGVTAANHLAWLAYPAVLAGDYPVHKFLWALGTREIIKATPSAARKAVTYVWPLLAMIWRVRYALRMESTPLRSLYATISAILGAPRNVFLQALIGVALFFIAENQQTTVLALVWDQFQRLNVSQVMGIYPTVTTIIPSRYGVPLACIYVVISRWINRWLASWSRAPRVQGVSPDVHLGLRVVWSGCLPVALHTFLHCKTSKTTLEGRFLDAPGLGRSFMNTYEKDPNPSGLLIPLTREIYLAEPAGPKTVRPYGPASHCVWLTITELVLMGSPITLLVAFLLMPLALWASFLVVLGLLIALMAHITISVLGMLHALPNPMCEGPNQALMQWMEGVINDVTASLANMVVGWGEPPSLAPSYGVDLLASGTVLTALMISEGADPDAATELVSNAIEDTVLQRQIDDYESAHSLPSLTGPAMWLLRLSKAIDDIPTHWLFPHSRLRAIVASCTGAAVATAEFQIQAGLFVISALIWAGGWIIPYNVEFEAAITYLGATALQIQKRKKKSVWGLSPLRAQRWIAPDIYDFPLTGWSLSSRADDPKDFIPRFSRILRKSIDVNTFRRQGTTMNNRTKAKVVASLNINVNAKASIEEIADFHIEESNLMTERANRYAAEYGAALGIDGAWLAHTDLVGQSLDRYAHEENNTTYLELEKLTAQAMFESMPNAFTQQGLTDPNYIIKYMLSEGRHKYSPGIPFLAMFKTRQEMHDAGWMDILKQTAVYLARKGIYPGQYYHAFVKSQVVAADKVVVPGKLRTVVAQDLLSSMIDRIARFQVTDRHLWFECRNGLGMPTTPGTMHYIAEEALKRKQVFTADITAADANLPSASWRVIRRLIALGAPEGSMMNSQAKAHYHAQRRAVIFNTHSGLTIMKRRGGGTGKSSTSADNTWATEALIVMVTSIASGLSPLEFYKHNWFHNTGDDNVWATDLDIDPDEFARIALEHFGVILRIEGRGALEGQSYLSKVFVRSTADIQEWYKEHGQEAPEWTVVTSPQTLLMRRSAVRRFPNVAGTTEYYKALLARSAGHIDLTFFQPQLYDLIITEYMVDLERSCGRLWPGVKVQSWETQTDGHGRTVAATPILAPRNPENASNVRACERARLELKGLMPRAFTVVNRNAIRAPESLGHMSAADDHPISEPGVYALARSLQNMVGLIATITPSWALALTPSSDVYPSVATAAACGHFIEPFLYHQLTDRAGEVTLQGLTLQCQLSPYASATDPNGFWDRMGYEPEALVDPVTAKGRIIIVTAVALYMNFLINSAKRASAIVSILLSIFQIGWIELPRVYALANYGYWLHTGTSSDEISTLQPRDSYANHKFVAVCVSSLAPDAVSYGIGKLIGPLTIFFKWVSQAVAILLQWRITQLFRPEEKSSRPAGLPVNNWRAHIPLIYDGLTPSLLTVVSSPTATGKSTKHVAALWEARRYDRIILLVPRNNLRDEYSNPWLHEGLISRITHATPPVRAKGVWVMTYGHAYNFFHRAPEFLSNAIVLADEFHETSIDVIAVYKYFTTRRVTMVAMSATPRTPLTDQVRFIEVPVSRPANITRLNWPNMPIQNAIAEATKRWPEQAQTMLIICPSLRTCSALQVSLKLGGKDARIVSRFHPTQTGTHIRVATQVVDAGVNIPGGVDIVIDEGLETLNDRGRLTTGPVTIDTSTQRAGRTGRLRDGIYINLAKEVRTHRPLAYPTWDRLMNDPPTAEAFDKVAGLTNPLRSYHTHGERFDRYVRRASTPVLLTRGRALLWFYLNQCRDHSEAYICYNAFRANPSTEANSIAGASLGFPPGNVRLPALSETLDSLRREPYTVHTLQGELHARWINIEGGQYYIEPW